LSALEDQFLSLWQAHYPRLILEREFSDITAWELDYQERYSRSKRSKRYRLDFAHPDSRTGIEIQGGVYSRGRHVTGSGYERDCKKYNLAYTSGWTIFLLTSTMAKDAAWLAVIASHIAAQSQRPHS
jgi:very-short-patch-repair endonuclease